MSEYIHAALLLHFAKKEINEENLKSVMKAAGIEPDEARVKVLVSSLSTVDINQILSSQQVPSVAISAPSPAQAAAAPSGKAEEAKPEAKEEKKEEEFVGLGALFE
jgi:large subunit ribosomal protein L12